LCGLGGALGSLALAAGAGFLQTFFSFI